MKKRLEAGFNVSYNPVISIVAYLLGSAIAFVLWLWLFPKISIHFKLYTTSYREFLVAYSLFWISIYVAWAYLYIGIRNLIVYIHRNKADLTWFSPEAHITHRERDIIMAHANKKPGYCDVRYADDFVKAAVKDAIKKLETKKKRGRT